MKALVKYLSSDYGPSANLKHTLQKADKNNGLTIWGFTSRPDLKKNNADHLILIHKLSSDNYEVVIGKVTSDIFEAKHNDYEWPDEKNERRVIYPYRILFQVLCIIKNVNLNELKKYQKDNKNIPYQGFTYIEFYDNLCELLHKNKNTSSHRNLVNFLPSFLDSLHSAGLIYSRDLVVRFVAALKAKPFVILTGLTGSGKTKLAQAFAWWITESDEQYRIIAVGADWTNRDPLFGYVNALNPKEYIKPENGALDILIKAYDDPYKPYFLILDEMNLSHVERYFADFLSVMESGEEFSIHSYSENISGVPSKLPWPENLFIIGTVNIDETTYMFSPKVLDRAQVIEFRIDTDQIKNFLQGENVLDLSKLKHNGAGFARAFLGAQADGKVDFVNDVLVEFFEELKKIGAEFGFRTASEIKRFVAYLKLFDEKIPEDKMIDFAIMHKLLPKVHGSRRRLVPVLESLAKLCLKPEYKSNYLEVNVLEDENWDVEGIRYPLSLEKIRRMYKNAIENGYASFAEA